MFEDINRSDPYYSKLSSIRDSDSVLPLVNSVLQISVPLVHTTVDSLKEIAKAHPYFCFTQSVDRMFTGHVGAGFLNIPQGTSYVATQFKKFGSKIYVVLQAYDWVDRRKDEALAVKTFEVNIYNISDEWGEKVAQSIIDGIITVNNGREKLFGQSFPWQNKSFSRTDVPIPVATLKPVPAPEAEGTDGDFNDTILEAKRIKAKRLSDKLEAERKAAEGREIRNNSRLSSGYGSW